MAGARHGLFIGGCAGIEEALELIKMAWTQPEPFGWLGKYYEYKTVSIWPRPVQAPHP